MINSDGFPPISRMICSVLSENLLGRGVWSQPRSKEINSLANVLKLIPEKAVNFKPIIR
ncbi:hypothetical protein J6590_071576 [Homalodisca vitripennis]|nr:hypothetical protein J6590_071576 [Homalodisca vitripennis]